MKSDNVTTILVSRATDSNASVDDADRSSQKTGMQTLRD